MRSLINLYLVSILASELSLDDYHTVVNFILEDQHINACKHLRGCITIDTYILCNLDDGRLSPNDFAEFLRINKDKL